VPPQNPEKFDGTDFVLNGSIDAGFGLCKEWQVHRIGYE
jgi:hypothetical protein